jgi:hypothetical protein
MDSQYDTNAWAAEVSLGRRVFAHNYALRGNEFTGWELVKTTTAQHADGPVEKVFIWQRKGSPEESIHVSVVETAYWAHALQHLKSQLDHCMRPNLPRGTAKTADVGDIQFESQAPGSGNTAAVFFSRGNLQVSVRSAGERPVNVVKFAAAIDERLTQPVSVARQKQEAAKKLKPGTLAVKKGQRAVVLQPLPERTRRSGWVRVIAPDGELRREDDALYYLPEQAGEKRIDILNFSLE